MPDPVRIRKVGMGDGDETVVALETSEILAKHTKVTPTEFGSTILDRKVASEKYNIGQEIARGGMGAILRAEDCDLQRTTVLKAILPKSKADPNQFDSFIAEARLTAGLEHPNIIPVHELGILPDDTPFFSMKMVRGDSLGQVLQRISVGDQIYLDTYNLYKLLTVFRKVCDAIAFAHAKGIIHRDIKPDNIMVAHFGEVLVMDWGLARVTRVSDGEVESASLFSNGDSRKTQFGIIKGTPAYMPPELAKGLVDEIDHRSDVFLLGSTLYAIATLESPYSGDDVYEILSNAESGNFVDPAIQAPERDIPQELCNIISKAMAYERGDRYQSVEELAAAIDDLLAGHTASVRRSFAAGEMIMREGEQGTEAYMITRGEVEVFKEMRGQSVRLMSLTEGDTVGEMAVISPAPRSASVRAVTDTEVFVITEPLIQRGLEKLPPWMGKIITALSDRLRTANASVHPLMQGDCRYHVLNQLRLLYANCGLPAVDTLSEKRTLALNTEKAIAEISTTLCISRDPVIRIFGWLLRAGIVKPLGSDRCFVPNFQLLSNFTEYCRKKTGTPTHFPANECVSTLFATDTEVIVRYVVADAAESGEEIKTIVQYTPEKIMGCESEEGITECFEKLYNELTVPVAG